MNKSSLNPTWTEFLSKKEEATSIIEENPWVGIVLAWLSCVCPYVTRCQVADFLRDVLYEDQDDWQSKASQRVRFCFNKLSKCKVLSDPIKTFFRPVLSLGDALFDTCIARDNMSSVLGPLWVRNRPNYDTLLTRPAPGSEPQTAYRLRLDSPATSVIKHASSNSEVNQLLSEQAFALAAKDEPFKSRNVPGATRLELMNLPHWLGNAELFIQSVFRNGNGELWSPVTVAMPSSVNGRPPRLLAFRHDALHLLGPINNATRLDEECNKLRREMIEMKREQAIAFSYLPKDWYCDEFQNSQLVLSQIENERWRQAKIF